MRSIFTKFATTCLMLLLVAIPALAQSEKHPEDITKSGKVFLGACSSVDKQTNELSSYETHTLVQCLS